MRLGSALERFGGNYGMQMKMGEGVGGSVCVCVCVHDWHHYCDAWKLVGEKGRHLYSLLISHLPN